VDRYKLAVIEGDGTGHEVVPEGLRGLEAAARRYDIVSEDRPEDAGGLDQLRGFDVIYFGAVGYPRFPGPDFAVGVLIPMRRAFQRYVNLRPVRLLPGIDSSLKNFPPGQIDMSIVRENDLGGKAGTRDVADAVPQEISVVAEP